LCTSARRDHGLECAQASAASSSDPSLPSALFPLFPGSGGAAGADGANRPSFLLFVTDTTRADSTSAYGAVSGTTPALDALAAAGLRYRRTYANAPWTLPSHATLFTGLLPHQHGVSWQRTTAPDELVTLAERLQDAGYQTVGFAENASVGSAFNLNQGCEHFQMVGRFNEPLNEALAAWLPKRDPARPLFLFMGIDTPLRVKPSW
jgi:hypothetical protein